MVADLQVLAARNIASRNNSTSSITYDWQDMKNLSLTDRSVPSLRYSPESDQSQVSWIGSFYPCELTLRTCLNSLPPVRGHQLLEVVSSPSCISHLELIIRTSPYSSVVELHGTSHPLHLRRSFSRYWIRKLQCEVPVWRSSDLGTHSQSEEGR